MSCGIEEKNRTTHHIQLFVIRYCGDNYNNKKTNKGDLFVTNKQKIKKQVE